MPLSDTPLLRAASSTPPAYRGRSPRPRPPADAVAAARAVQAGTASGIPKSRDGVVESIRALRVARNGAIKSHTAAINALRQMIITAPAELREQLTGLGPKALVNTCARLRPGDLHDPTKE